MESQNCSVRSAVSQRDDGVFDGRPGRKPAASAWPLYVRVLAVSYVLSYAVQWLAVLGFTGTAAVLFGMRRQLDGPTIGLGLGGVVSFMLCGGFRSWFVRWGRRNYPDGKPE